MQKEHIDAGDRVLVQVNKSAGAVVLYLACLRIGAVYVPLNDDYTAAEVAYFLSDSAPDLFVCRPESSDQMAELARLAGVRVIHTLGNSLDGSFGKLANNLTPFEALANCAPGDVARKRCTRH